MVHRVHSRADAPIRGVAVAHCPRSNRRHHHADAPVGRYIDSSLRIGIGADSAVSVAPLDLRAEAREARKLTGGSAAETVRALTLGGAEALGLDAGCGSLAVGKWGDMTVISYPRVEVA